MNVKITKLRPTAHIPTYGTAGAAAFDLTTSEMAIVLPHGQALLPTGLVFRIPEDHVMHIFPRSSTFGRFGLLLSNSVGVIDSDYCGSKDEVKIMVYNPGEDQITIEAGTRIAQAIIYPRPKITFIESDIDSKISRGGFGSTG